MRLHQVGEHVDSIPGTDPSGHMDRQALTRILIDDHHELDRPTVIGAIKDKVPRPHMIATFRSQADAGSIFEPQPTTLRLLVRHFQTLTLPDP